MYRLGDSCLFVAKPKTIPSPQGKKGDRLVLKSISYLLTQISGGEFVALLSGFVLENMMKHIVVTTQYCKHDVIKDTIPTSYDFFEGLRDVSRRIVENTAAQSR